MGDSFFRFEALDATPLVKEPFEYVIVPNFIAAPALARLNADYPKVTKRGSFPVNVVPYGPAFQDLLDELESDHFRAAFERKFGLDLSGRPTVATVRGQCGAGDGQIHTDSKTKIITVLLYPNDEWAPKGGRLRLLRSGTDLNDFVAEVSPIGGTLLAFRRADNSWHGHEPFVGERKVIQFNWLTTAEHQRIAMLRHHASAAFKRTTEVLWPTQGH
jgi:hypothetical protein